MQHHHPMVQAIQAAGLRAKQYSPAHWQILGGKHLVNVWPDTKRGFRFQRDGEGSGLGTIEDAIKLAGPPEQVETETPWEEAPQQPEARERIGLIRWLWGWIW